MSTRFAGSRSVDERRRRRLATEFDGDAVSAVADESQRSDSGSLQSAAPSQFTPSRLPLRKLVSPRIWKHVLIAFGGLLLGGLIVAAGLHVEEIERVCGPEAARLADFESGDMVSTFCALTLFLSGQLSLLIWWARSRSREDFSGRYRIWAWAALFGFTASLAMATDLHHIWTATLLWTWEFGFWKQETLLWLAPAVGSASALIWEVKREFRDCRGSIALFSIAILAWSTSVGLMLFDDLIELGEPMRVATIAGLTMLGYLSLMLALLLHARHVIYITAEPPQERPSAISKLARRCVPSFRIRIRLPRRRKKKAVVAGDASDSGSEKVAVAQQKNQAPAAEPVAPVVRKQEPEPAPKPVQPEPATKQPEPAQQEPVVAKAPQPESVDDAYDDEPRQNVSKNKRLRVDDGLDPSQLKGLSKKERRKLRKEHRERQRAAQNR